MFLNYYPDNQVMILFFIYLQLYFFCSYVFKSTLISLYINQPENLYDILIS